MTKNNNTSTLKLIASLMELKEPSQEGKLAILIKQINNKGRKSKPKIFLVDSQQQQIW